MQHDDVTTPNQPSTDSANPIDFTSTEVLPELPAWERTTMGLAEAQFGLITRDQALSAGMTKRQIDLRQNRSRWERIHPGVYRVAGTPRTWLQQAKAAVLWAGKDGALSHRAAARLHRLKGFEEDSAIELTTQRNKGSLAGVAIHKRGGRHPLIEEIEWVHGLPVTPVWRTLFDLCGCCPPDEVLAATEQAVRFGATNLDLLLDVIETSEHHPGVIAFKTMLARLPPNLEPVAVSDAVH